MDQIRFEHECHINSLKFEEGKVVNEDQLPPEWLVGALKHKFVTRIPATLPATPSGVVPADVDAAVKAAIAP